MTKKPKRLYQFGLRKLLLWTAVVALLFGTAQTLGDGWILAACWITIGVGIRMVTNWRVAGVLLAFVGPVVLLVVVSSALQIPRLFVFLLLTCPPCCTTGIGLFVIIELLYRAVNWIDELFSRLGAKPDAPVPAD